jgi:hypothetical protein
MTIKYCWFVRNESELEAWYPVAHVPVDEFILRAAKEAGIKCPCEKWSRWDNPKKYEEFQKLIRNEADELGKTPLALEHDWWMEKAATMSQQIAMTQEELEGLIVKDVRRHAHCTGFKAIRVHRIADDQIPGTNWSYGNSGMDYGGADEKVCNDALREVVYRMQRQYRLS